MSIETDHRRLAILQYLDRAPDYTCNTIILLDVVRGIGVATTQSQLSGALAWLEEQDLLTLTGLDDVTIATITARGSDVARGVAIQPGVARPGPKG